MSLWIDHKYMGLLSFRLERFARKDKNLYNFRCPICGDSHKNKFKARGYAMAKQDKIFFYCHNCGANRSMYDFVKEIDPELHKQYVLETYEEKNIGKKQKINYKPDISKFSRPKYMMSVLKDLKKISQLPVDHKAKKYIQSRKIPNPYHAKLFYTPKFCTWINSIIKDKFDEKVLALDEGRIVIPFIDEDGKVYGLQGRALSNTSLRYITIMFDESKPKVFGLDTVDFSKNVYIVEGPFDSMFISNCLAMAGSDMDSSLFPNARRVYIYDNEPRSKEIVAKIDKRISNGDKVFIWPEKVKYKDINDCILGGMSPLQIKEMIKENTHESLSAKCIFTNWRKN